MGIVSAATWLALAAVCVTTEPADDGDDQGSSGSANVGVSGSAEGYRSSRAADRKKQAQEEKKQEQSEPWIRRWAPESNELDAGLYLGGFVLARNHGLFDPGQGPQPQVDRGAFAMGFRLSYFPLAFLGLGVEGGFKPTSSDELGVRATLFDFRGHAIAQLPYRITPTFVIGAGLLGIDSPSSRLRSQDAAFHYGPGIKFHINKWIAMRADGRHLVAGDGNNSQRQHHGEITLGIEATIRIGRYVQRRRARFDADGDGIKDGSDRCPKEYGEPEFDGCTEGQDRDDDGTPDAKDRCPDQWGDLPNGCPTHDIDGDGIFDKGDQCPEEPETYNQVNDSDGCPDQADPDAPVSTVPITKEEAKKEIARLTGVIEGISFDTGRATIRESSHATLDTAVQTLKKFPQVELEIVGHTDSTGRRNTNQKLSEDRAAAVKKYLVDKGVEASRLRTRGAGQDEPIDSNATSEGRARNRRIEFIIKKR